MDAQGQLGLLATIAATYSGFIAVFIAFVGKDGRFLSSDGHFVQAMVLSTMGVVVLSLAPPVLFLLEKPETVWWQVTLFAVVVGAPAGVFQTWQQVKEARDKTQRIAPFWHVPGWLLGLGSFASFVAALMQPELRPGFYVAGVTMALGVAIWCFIAVTFRRFF